MEIVRLPLPPFTVLAQKGREATPGVVLKLVELVTKDNHCPPFIAQSTDGVDGQDLVTKDHHHRPLSTGQAQIGWTGKTCGCTEDGGTRNTRNNLSDGPPCLARQQFGILISQTCWVEYWSSDFSITPCTVLLPWFLLLLDGRGEGSHQNGSTAKAKPCYSSLNKLSGPADKTVQVKQQGTGHFNGKRHLILQ